jgi:hypothetical protein
MKPEHAVFQITSCLRRNLCLVQFAANHDADHLADDGNKEHPYNRKARQYSQIRNRRRRFQEIVLGGIQFLTKDLHSEKTIKDADISRALDNRVLFASRAIATEAHTRTLDVRPIEDFTAFLREPDAGDNWDWKGFLHAVLPYWKMEDAKGLSTIPHVLPSSPWLQELTDKVNALSLNAMSTE